MLVARAVAAAAAPLSKQHNCARALRPPQVAVEGYGAGGNVNEMLFNDWLCDSNHCVTSLRFVPCTVQVGTNVSWSSPRRERSPAPRPPPIPPSIRGA